MPGFYLAHAIAAGRLAGTMGIMHPVDDTHREFEALARSFLAERIGIRHEWRVVRDGWDGRTDLICEAGSAKEVFASLRSDQITVGTRDVDIDFESFGRNLSDAQIAQEAFAQFRRLLREQGIMESDLA